MSFFAPQMRRIQVISWWRAEGDTGDAVGSNPGTLHGYVSFPSSEVGQGLHFDAPGSCVELGNPTSLHLQDFTIEAWIKRDSATDVTWNDWGVTQFLGGYTGAYGFGMWDNGSIFLMKWDDSVVSSSAKLTDTASFHHVAVTKSGTNVIFYIDGVAETATPYNPGFVFNSMMAIGARGDHYFTFLGAIDELSIYNRALTLAEVQTIFSAAGAAKCISVAPTLTLPPASQAVAFGANATFTVAASGSAPLAYQWHWYGTNLAGQTGTALALNGLQFSNAGPYSVVVSNSAGSVTSSNAMLTVTTCTEPTFLAAVAGGGTVALTCDGTIILSGTITIDKDTKILANGHSVTIDGGNAVRLFQVNTNVHFEVQGLTLANGASIGPRGMDGTVTTSGGDGLGGGILNQGGTVALTGCLLTNLVAVGGHAGQLIIAPPSQPLRDGGSAFGGAICNLGGKVNLTHCVLANSQATGGTGDQWFVYSLNQGNGGPALGGAIYSVGGNIVLDGVTITNSLASGGKWRSGSGGDGMGGAIYASNSTVFANNSQWFNSRANGGDPTSTDDDGGRAAGYGFGGSLYLSSDSSATLRLCSISGSSVNGGNGTRLSSARSGLGGAIYNAGYLETWDSTLLGNSSTGGSPFLTPPAYGRGGAIYSTGQVVINRCTFSSNSSFGGYVSDYHTGQYAGATGDGGAIWSSGSLLITNSTIVTNKAVGGSSGLPASTGPGASGGGVCVSAGTATLVNVTVAGNRADGWYMFPGSDPAYGGGLYSGGAVTAQNSIFAYSGHGGNVWGYVFDGGHNLSSDGSDPLLGPLTNNGGPTATMLLLPGSPARNAIPSGFPATDQRGVKRPQGSGGDIGAVEGEAVTRPPQLCVGCVGNNVVITATADLGRCYRLLASTNLMDWVPVATNTLANTGLLQFSPAVTMDGGVFFKVVTP
jgi:hypothetical protein